MCVVGMKVFFETEIKCSRVPLPDSSDRAGPLTTTEHLWTTLCLPVRLWVVGLPTLLSGGAYVCTRACVRTCGAQRVFEGQASEPSVALDDGSVLCKEITQTLVATSQLSLSRDCCAVHGPGPGSAPPARPRVLPSRPAQGPPSRPPGPGSSPPAHRTRSCPCNPAVTQPLLSNRLCTYSLKPSPHEGIIPHGSCDSCG